mmetsp:Transcript_4019/g.14630  ORF Transcript_4019/g.14630 Transcript_4019/m.14630 type:complete len:233 (+) Transcript_4019:2761-3459(+)
MRCATTSRSSTASLERKYGAEAVSSATSLNPCKSAAMDVYTRRHAPTRIASMVANFAIRITMSFVKLSRQSRTAGRSGSPGTSGHPPMTHCSTFAVASNTPSHDASSYVAVNTFRHTSSKSGVCPMGTVSAAAPSAFKTTWDASAGCARLSERARVDINASPIAWIKSGISRVSAKAFVILRITSTHSSWVSWERMSNSVSMVVACGSTSLKSNADNALTTDDHPRERTLAS